MSHCDFATNLKTGEVCLLDYCGIQRNVRNLSLWFMIDNSKTEDKYLTAILGFPENGRNMST